MRRNRIHEEADKLSPQKNKPNRFQLYSFEMIPEYLQSNPYIRTGYRHGLNVKECLFSLLYLNNESVNIWSHLIGTGLFIYFFFRDIYAGHALPYLSSTSDYYFVLFYTFSVITCMLCSTLFHLFGCISSQAFADFLKLDLCGIGLGILGCYLCGLHLSFECYRSWRIRYETLIICIMFIAVIYYVHGVRRYITRNIHTTLFVTVSLFGFLPGFHWYYLHGGWSNQFVQHFFPKLFVLYLILSVGTIAYLTKFPERFFPGYFDFIFASHQIWHISSLGAFIWWYQNGVDLLQYRLSNPCHTLQN
ncbi:unnamed protein product [Rotaria magnacalcarata]|uniref:Progestin and adipoQ receptor family member 3 n=3 Tax=Rotaria magnacalcarata TaxID=392030 RepID=A0A819F6Q7_9BILA|nr:unnamed protein product [Rotaria magnacalcarata]CAF2091495.1 unnamed protein product [Rotaria magnacalcarata]CAF2137928.1 unnamed protein product [Rotaria magnacalcarata]CAF3863604.1 unnamed protein product [Rotaria magnacalcarata]CAF3903627.1 unnamed protein product [Rotaria magnacalcarata]